MVLSFFIVDKISFQERGRNHAREEKRREEKRREEKRSFIVTA